MATVSKTRLDRYQWVAILQNSEVGYESVIKIALNLPVGLEEVQQKMHTKTNTTSTVRVVDTSRVPYSLPVTRRSVPIVVSTFIRLLLVPTGSPSFT